jgi:superfamily II DNA or RNA helicase
VNTPQPAGDLPTLRFDRGLLVLEGTIRSPEESLAGDWRFQPETGLWVCDAGNYPLLKGGPFRDMVPAWPVFRTAAVSHLKAQWPAQALAVEGWMRLMRGIVEKPTGTGKTQIALYVIERLACSTLVVAPTLGLARQWQMEIADVLGCQSSFIAKSQWDPRQNLLPIAVTTYHSACIHMPYLGDRFEFIIWDEVHHLPGAIRGDAARMSAAPYRMGLSATLPKGQALEVLLNLAGPVVYRQEIEDEVGHSLAQYEVVDFPVTLAPEEQREYNELKTRVVAFYREKQKTEPKYGWRELCRDSARDRGGRMILRDGMRRRALEAGTEAKMRAIEVLLQKHPTTPTLIWTSSAQAAREVAKRFLFPVILSGISLKEQMTNQAGFKSGKYPALVSCLLNSEGIDLPNAKVGIVIGGTSSERLAIQRLGRVLRKSGGAKAVFYDVYCANSADEKRSKARRDNSPYRIRKRRAPEKLC